MPRIRTLKPEHRQHRKVGALSDREYRLWVGMICEADDEGRLVADAEGLRALLWSYHPSVTADDVESALTRLVSTRLVRVWWVGRTRYAFFPDWKQHQRINRPQESKLPQPKTKRANSDSMNAHGTFTEPSLIGVHGSDPKGSEGIKDRIGREGSGEGVDNPSPVDNPPTRTVVRAPNSIPSNSTPTLTPDELRGLPLVAQARGISLAQAKSELVAAKLRAGEATR